MGAKYLESFLRSDTRVVLFLTVLLLIGGAVIIYQKSKAVIYPEVVINHLESGAYPARSSYKSPGAVTKELLIKYKININTAPADSLALLPGIGTYLAKRIIDYRGHYGLFEKVDDVKLVNGIGPKKLKVVRDMITIGDK